MIDPRFANAGAIPLIPAGFGAQQMPLQYHHHHHHRHHRHHKQKARNDESPVSRDESIHKVDHNQHYIAPNGEAPMTSSTYGNTGFEAGYTPGFHQQQQYDAGVFGYANSHPGAVNGDDAFLGIPLEQTVTAHQRHRRHHRRHHTVEAENIGNHDDEERESDHRRAASVVSNEGEQIRSPVPLTDGDVNQGHDTQRRQRHRHRDDEHSSGRKANQPHQPRGHTSVGPDGYGHINSDLIFIERGDHSPHRQDAPRGYEYKGKIEVQGIDKEYRSRSHGSGSRAQPQVRMPAGTAQISQANAPTATCGPCPSGWAQMMMSATPGGICPSGGLSYSGQIMGAFGNRQPAYGTYGAGAYGMPAIGGGYPNFGTNMPFLPQCQYMTDYVYGSNTGAGTTVAGTTGGYQQPTGTAVQETRRQSEQMEERVSDRPTIIEVWQRRSKSEKPSSVRSQSSTPDPNRSPTRRSHRPHLSGTGASPLYDLERFRNELLRAIERMVPRSNSHVTDLMPTKGHGGTQTDINPNVKDEPRPKPPKISETTPGEVRVIVQSVQPIFYMPKQSDDPTAPSTTVVRGNELLGGPERPFQSESASRPPQQPITGGPNVVYVPRNVYVPVIKPVFVPRERVIVRPQVIHVARPVLVDRPVPVTQRPIIIDRERPVPVPVRGGSQTIPQATNSKPTHEDFVYRDNVPSAYGGRFADTSGGENYGYTPATQDHQYASSPTPETTNAYQTQIPSVDVNVSGQYQQNQSAAQFDTQTGSTGSFSGSYTNLMEPGASYNPDINNDYLAAQQTHQYPTDSTHEAANIYPTETSTINVNIPSQYQPSQSTSHFQAQQGSNLVYGVADDYQKSFENVAQASGTSASGSGQIEVLDAAVNPNWQKTDPSSLVRRYGRPAFEIVHKSEEVEQRMYNELRQRGSTSSMVRHSSTASYGSGSGIGFNGSDMFQY